MELILKESKDGFFNRLDIFLLNKNLNDNKVSRDCNISNGLIGKARKRGSLSQENISKLLDIYEELDANWLMTGRGKMILTNIDPSVRMIPIVKMDKFVEFQKTINIENQKNNKFIGSNFISADFLIEINSIISNQKYKNGDFLACKKLVGRDLFLQWNNVFLLDTKLGVWVKRIVKGKDDNHLLILSDIKSHDSFEIRMSEINALALVIGVVKVD